VNAALIQKRRVMSRNSGLSSPLAVLTLSGSRAMPQTGQAPGSRRTISGCIGQVYCVSAADIAESSTSKAMPHLGQATGTTLLTSGHIGQKYLGPVGRLWVGAARPSPRLSAASVGGTCFATGSEVIPSCIKPEEGFAGIFSGFAPGAR
jgi:hypothetical protein